MVQKENQAALEERESERSANPAAPSGASLEPPAAPAPGEDNASGAGAAAGAGASGGTRRFLCGVVEGESALRPRERPAGGSSWGLPNPTPGRKLALANTGGGRREETEGETHFSSDLERPILLATQEPDPTLLGLGARQTVEEEAGVRSLLSALCFTSLYLGILVSRVVCFEMRKFVQRSGPHPCQGVGNKAHTGMLGVKGSAVGL